MNPSQDNEKRYYLITFLAIIFLAITNLIILNSRSSLLYDIVPQSPNRAGYYIFLAILVPLFMVFSSLLSFLIYRIFLSSPPKSVKLAEGVSIALLPAAGFALIMTENLDHLFQIHGVIYVCIISLRLLGLLIFAHKFLDDRNMFGGKKLYLILFGLPLVVYIGIFLWLGTTFSTTGDEPYYLMVAESIAMDRDLVLDNQFIPENFGKFYWKDYLAPQNMIKTPSGLRSNAYSTFFPLMLAPSTFIHARWGPSILIIIISSFLSAQIYLLCRELIDDNGAAFFAWAFTSFTLPLLGFSSQIYPETTAALLSTILFRHALAETREGEARTSSITAILVSAVLLPALKIRYLPISFAGLAVFSLRSRKPKKTFLIAAVFVLAAISFIVADYFFLEKSLILSRFSTPGVIFRFRKLLRFWPSSLAGFFADQEFGLFFYSPVFLVVPAGIIWAARRREIRSMLLLLPISFYLIVLIGHFGHLWYGGFSQPSRYAVVVLPFFAPFLGWAWKKSRGPYLISIAILSSFWSLLIAFPFFIKASMRYNQADGVNNILAAINNIFNTSLDKVFPSFMNPEAWRILGLLLTSTIILAPSIPLILTRGGFSKRSTRSLLRRSSATAAGLAVLIFFLGWIALRRPTNILEAESISHSGGKLYTGYVRGNVMVFENAGWVEGDIITRDEKPILVIKAGARANRGCPSMEIFIDGLLIERITMEAGKKSYLKKNYFITLSIKPGKHSLRVRVIPASSPSSTVFLDRFTFIKPENSS